MNIKKEILKGHSKERALLIANYVGAKQDRFTELIQLFFESPYRLIQRVTWPIELCLKKHPKLIDPHLGNMVKRLKSPVPVALKRNTLRLWQYLDIPKPLKGNVADICFGLLSGTKESIAVKVFSMTVLANLTKEIPELCRELKLLLEGQYPYGSAGFKSRTRKVIQTLKKIDI